MPVVRHKMDIITSRDNQSVKNTKKLLEKASARKKQGLFVAEGVKMCDEALMLGKAETLILSESFYDKCLSGKTSDGPEARLISEKGQHISDAAKCGKALVFSDGVFNSLSDTVHPQGVMALVKMAENRVFDKAFLQDAYDKNGRIKLLILDDVADPGNLGTMMRTAEAAGMTGVVMSKGCVDIYNPKTVRSTMGSIFRVPFEYVENIVETSESLKKLSVKLYVTHLKGEKYFNEITYFDRSAVVIGNEARGVSDELAGICDTLVKIPMHGKVESLNAGIAAALMMYAL